MSFVFAAFRRCFVGISGGLSVEIFNYKNVGDVFNVCGRFDNCGKRKSARSNFDGLNFSNRKVLRKNSADSGSYDKVSAGNSAFLRKIFKHAKFGRRKSDVAGNNSRISGGNIVNARLNGNIKNGPYVGIGKTHFPDYSNKAVRGDDRVCRFNAVDASLIDGEGIKTVGGISADYRGRFKVLVRVGFFKTEEFAELFVFALFLFIVDKFFVRVPKFFLKFLNS